jgi:hypothetical protein
MSCVKNLKEYFTGAPLKSDVESLCDPNLDFDAHREDVNDLVMNAVIKYLAEYMESPPDITALKEILDREFTEIKRLADNAAYFVMTHNNPDIKGTHASVHSFPLKCLVDVRSTTAIFKEIAFNDAFADKKSFRGLDLGSGTGILLLAMHIAAMRKGASDILCVGAEIRELAVKKSRKALEKILGDKAKILEMDLMKRRVVKKLLKKYPPDFWVSETISDTTPSLILNYFNLGVLDKYRKKLERTNDPLVELLSETVKYDPEFFNKVWRQEITMFPDPVHKLYRPDKAKSTLVLETGLGSPLLLHEIGEEFIDYEDLGYDCKRWPAKAHQNLTS